MTFKKNLFDRIIRRILFCGSILFLWSCNNDSYVQDFNFQQIVALSEKYGFKAQHGVGEGLIFNSVADYELFLKFLKNQEGGESVVISNLLASQIEAMDINISNSFKIENSNNSTENISGENFKILCIENAHLVNARLPIIYGGVFPSYEAGGALGVNFMLNIQNGSLTNNIINTYGIVPFTGIVGGDVQLQFISGNTYNFFATYQLSYNIVIDDLTFYVTEPRYATIRVDACTGSTTVDIAYA